MSINKSNSQKSFEKGQAKNTNYSSELKTIFHYLKQNTATASMISLATNIPHKNICRYKRDLENAGLLKEVEKKRCEKTTFKAWYLTTNLNLINIDNQLKIFNL